MKKKKKPISWRKIILIAFASFIAIAVSAISFVLIVTSDSRLDLTKLSGEKRQNLTITAEDGTTISETISDELSAEVTSLLDDGITHVRLLYQGILMEILDLMNDFLMENENLKSILEF